MKIIAISIALYLSTTVSTFMPNTPVSAFVKIPKKATKNDVSCADFSNHKININKILKKNESDPSEPRFKTFDSLSNISIDSLILTEFTDGSNEWIGHLKAIKRDTISSLAVYRAFKVARAIATLSKYEGWRPKNSEINLDYVIKVEAQNKTLNELLEEPVTALSDITENVPETAPHGVEYYLGEMGIHSIGDFAKWDVCLAADAIVELQDKSVPTKGNWLKQLFRKLKQLCKRLS